jgi:hypothetical protein
VDDAVEQKSFRIVRSVEDMSTAVREATTISSISVLLSRWRLPSRLLLEQKIARAGALLDDLPWLVPPERLEKCTEQVRSDRARYDQELEEFTSLHAKPITLREIRKRLIEFSPDDQVLKVSTKASLTEIQKALGEHGQCLPIASHKDSLFFNGAMGSLRHCLDFNLPHALEAQCGTWRDWVLGMTIVQADGTVAKSGSHAVKNVAGYDVHKLMIGARGTLGIVAEVILRTYPVSALPKPDLQVTYQFGNWRENAILRQQPVWIQRTRPSDFADAVKEAGERLLEADWASSTLCAALPAELDLPRFEGDWVLRSGAGAKNLQFTDPTQIRLMKRAKEIFDPAGKLNPGEMGIF